MFRSGPDSEMGEPPHYQGASFLSKLLRQVTFIGSVETWQDAVDHV